MAALQPSRPTLLIVDDDVLNGQLLQHIFEEDHTVVCAANGAEALAWCDAQLPDLILLDVMMPVMTGHEVCQALKADARTRDVPIIFVTSQNAPTEESAALQLGAVDFISKPVNAVVVRARVGAQLMLRQSLRAVQNLNETLEVRVALRTAELQRAMEHLERSQENLARSEAKATLNTLVAGVSHELGTPLSNSKMVASALTEHTRTMVRLVHSGRLKRSSLEQFLVQVNEGVTLLERNLERAFELLGDFRQVATDQASEQRRSFDLAHVVGEILHTMSPSLKRHPHQVVVDIAQGIILDSLPGPLGQIVINLVNNAYLHAFEGRIGVLRIDAQVQGDQVRVRFADNGVGMDAQHLDKMFLPFFSTKIGKGGTGLGMAIVQNLASKTLGGRISVASAVDEGTCFELVLPLVLPVGR